MNDITSGAVGDIKMATKIARSMVCDWGMSILGPIAYGDNQDHVFLGKEIARNQNYSEDTALRIDEAIRNLIDEQYQRATQLLKEHDAALETLAMALLEYETVEGKHVKEILETGKIQSEVRSIQSIEELPEEEPEQEKKEVEEDQQDEDEGLGPEATPAGAPA
jgi:cell division protease FtsH